MVRVAAGDAAGGNFDKGAAMSGLGKVFLGLTIVLAAADAYFVAVLHAHRSKWQQDIEKSRGDLAVAEESVKDLRARVLDKQNQLARIEAVWGRFPDNRQEGQDPEIGLAHLDVPQGGRVLNAQAGTLAVNAGVQAGITPPTEQAPSVVYVFADEPDGASQYLGEVALTEVLPDQAAGTLTQQPPLPTAVDALAHLQGQLLRVRETIPSSWRSQFDDYFARHAVINQRLLFQLNQLEIQTKELAKSQAIHDQRLAELNGDPQPPQGASQQVIDGLVLTIRDEETARNGELEQLDTLRHDFARKIELLNDLVRQNQGAVSELPGYEESLAKPEPRTASTK